MRISLVAGSSLIEARRPVSDCSQGIEDQASDIQGEPFVSTTRTSDNVQDSSQLQADAMVTSESKSQRRKVFPNVLGIKELINNLARINIYTTE